MDDFENSYEKSVEPEPEEVVEKLLSDIIKKYHLDED